MSRVVSDQAVIPPEVQIDVPEVAYPPLCLWQMDVPEGKRLQIINEDDFPLGEVLRGLGIAGSALVPSFGICDPDEIERRQALVRFFVEHPQDAERVRDLKAPGELPVNPEEFLSFADPSRTHNPYWKVVHSLVSMLDEASDVPPQLQELREALRDTLSLEETERQLTAVIADRISSVAVIEGLASFTVNQGGEQPFLMGGKQYGKTYPVRLLIHSDEDTCQVWGHLMYSFALSSYRMQPYPGWTESRWNPLNWIGIGYLVRADVNRRNRLGRAKALEPMVITELSSALIDDLRVAVLEKLNSVRWTERQIDQARVQVYFSYSEKGLRVQIYALDVRSISYGYPQSFEASEFEGYPEALKELISRHRKVYCAQVEEAVQRGASGSIRVAVEKQKYDFFSDFDQVPSPDTDMEHRWFAVSNLYSHPALKPAVEALRAHRSYFLDQLRLLKEMAHIALAYRKTAAQLKTTICFPEILGNGEHLVAFDSVLPAHLLSLEKVEPQPITGLQPMDGQMLGLTGHHGEGKTVTEITVATDIFLTQSGLPVLGSDFRLNPKRVLGMVFIENKQGGSTCELLLTKMKAVLEGIKGHNPNEVVVILDEVGTGTQEVAGLELGRDILATLADLGVSVIFSTQITDLARHAQDHLGASCYKFLPHHQITPGIGDGGMARLRKRVGIDPLLKRG